jgi:hypothetical protein
VPLSSDFTPYSTAKELLGTLPTWLDTEDAQRIASYQLYEEMYWNVPTIFRLDARGTENKPIYIPTARIVCDTINRYVGRSFRPRVNLAAGQANDQQAASAAMQALWIREEMRAKFATQKRFGIVRGDAFWHIVGNESASPGRRLSIYEVDPGSVFWIYDPNNLSRVTGVHIADQYHDNTLNKDVVRVQRYLKDPSGKILSKLSVRDLDGWDDPTKADLQVLKPEEALPDQITALPVYQTKNFRNTDSLYGSSQLRGFERLFAAVNQSVSDEELTLALEGIGVYATTSGPPTDDAGNETDWVLGPGRVVEHAVGTDFDRVGGVNSIEPFIAHQNQLLSFVYEASGIPQVLRGGIDVSVAESGIALYLKAMPMLSQVDEKNDLMADTYAHMFYDLQHGWFPAFEQISFETAVIEPQFGPALPEDRAGKVTEILSIAGAVVGETPVVSAAWVRNELSKVGYEFPAEIGVDVVQEAAALAEAQDAFATRMREESGGPVSTGEGDEL